MNGIRIETELKFLMENLPIKPYVGNFKQQSIITSKSKVSGYKYLQYNHPQIAKYICIDVDSMAIDVLSTNLYPNLLTTNIDNPKGHMLFRLDQFVGSTPNSRLKPQKYLRLATHSIINYLNALDIKADPAFNGQKTKNPFSVDFRVFSYRQDPWTIDEIIDNIPEEHVYIRKPEIVQGLETVEINGRNCYLFEKVRLESYKLKFQFVHFNQFYAAVEDFCLKANGNLSNPLGYGECKHIIKSITKWTWANYTGDQRNKGVMELGIKGHGLKKSEKEALGALYTAKIKRETTQELLQAVFDELAELGTKPTQKAVSERSGKSLRTVKNYWKQINR